MLVVVAGYGMSFLELRADYRVYFGPDNPQLQTFEKLQQTFSKSDNLLFLLEPADGEVFSRDNLALVETLTEAAWKVPYSFRVDSLSNYQHTSAEEDDLTVEKLVEGAAELDEEELQRIRRIALAEPQLVQRLVSPEADVTAVNVTLRLPGDSLAEVSEVVQFARVLKSRLEAEHPGLKVYLSGAVMMNSAFMEASLHDNRTLVPLMFAVILLLLALLFGSWWAALSILAVTLASILVAAGAAGWAGLYLTPPSAAAPIIVMTLAVADCVHILALFYFKQSQGEPKRQALLSSLKLNVQPVLLTSVTTAIGFLSLNFSDSPPFHDLGNIVAVGVVAACIFSLVLFPAILMLMPIVGRPRMKTRGNLAAVANQVIGRPRLFLVMVGVWVVVCVSFLPRNELNDNFVHYFDTQVPFRQAEAFAEKHLTGMSVMEFELKAADSGGINEPEFLRQVDAFSAWLRAMPETRHVQTLSDTMKRLNKNMHGDNPEYYRLPESRNMAAQYLLLYEMSLPYGLDLNDQINVDKSALRLIASFRSLTSNEMIDMERRALAWLEQHAPALGAQASGPSLMFAHIGARNIESMLKGTILALLLISLILGLALKSFKFGLISLIPNLVPAAVAFGIWGFWVAEVGLALSVVMGMTLGIIVDDTVHFLSKYLHARREEGAKPEEAVRYAFSSVGDALWVTTLVLASGFGILAFSDFAANGRMGLMTAMTIVIALFVDLLLLPALLLLIEGAHIDKNEKMNRRKEANL